MKLYIAGPMSGYPEYNFPAFHAAAKALRAAGHEVVSPAELDEVDYGGQESIHAMATKPGARKVFMTRDLPALLSCEGVFVLPGWTDSSGGLTELMVAVMCEMPIYGYNVKLNNRIDPKAVLFNVERKLKEREKACE